MDYIVDTVSAKHDLESYLALLKVDGKYVVVGVPPEPYQLNAGTLIGGMVPIPSCDYVCLIYICMLV